MLQVFECSLFLYCFLAIALTDDFQIPPTSVFSTSRPYYCILNFCLLAWVPPRRRISLQQVSNRQQHQANEQNGLMHLALPFYHPFDELAGSDVLMYLFLLH